MPFPTRSGKYNATKVQADNITFNSKAEHRRYCELKLLLQAGEISNLAVHPKLELKIGNQLAANYVADFNYIEGGKQLVWEDVKSPATETPVFKLKKRLIEILYPDIDLRIIPAGRVR